MKGKNACVYVQRAGKMRTALWKNGRLCLELEGHLRSFLGASKLVHWLMLDGGRSLPEFKVHTHALCCIIWTLNPTRLIIHRTFHPMSLPLIFLTDLWNNLLLPSNPVKYTVNIPPLPRR